MTEKMVQELVNLFYKYRLITEEQKDEYIYSLLCFLESVITIVSLLLIAVILGKFKQAIFFCIYFFLLRNRTGGMHLNSFVKCFIGSLLSFLLVIVCCDAVLIFHRLILWVITLLSTVIIWVIGAVNHINMNMNVEEFTSAKKGARLMLGIEMLLLIFMEWINADSEVITYSGCGIILCSILLVIAKLIGQEVKAHEPEV